MQVTWLKRTQGDLRKVSSGGWEFYILKRSCTLDGSCLPLAVAISRPAFWILHSCLRAHGVGLRMHEMKRAEKRKPSGSSTWSRFLQPTAPQMKLSGDWLLIFHGSLTELGPSNMPGKCLPLSCSPSLLQTGFKFSVAREKVQLYIEACLEFPIPVPASQLPGATCVCHHAQIPGGILTRSNRLFLFQTNYRTCLPAAKVYPDYSTFTVGFRKTGS